ncbi:Cytochrome P450 [Actinomadura meyerae]|jgi:cytochrome P450|uniref:Cytochrome P450 n=1 Tax=Actinomadura meyerae TaxID=240840 RepID=A0A239NFB2_9ACTN|nr:cytochrome P450 [Actinomadura meyerae]SNT53657.1 Cytochrome P450 [Actinomadura meyerae]
MTDAPVPPTPGRCPIDLAPDYAPPLSYAEGRPDDRPLCPVRLPSGDQVTMATRYEDVLVVLQNPVFSRELGYPGAPRVVDAADVHHDPDALINMDPPRHTRLRKLVSGAFTPRRLQAWQPRVESITEELVEEFGSGPAPADLVSGFSFVLPVRVICALLGVPADDHEQFRRWTTAFLSTTAFTARDRAVAREEFAGYHRSLIQYRREHPGDSLIDALISAADDRGSLTEPELVRLTMSLIVAGHGTTANLLTRAVFTLLVSGGYARLAADPARIPAAAEELLRREMPVDGGLRVALEDVELPSGPVRKGEVVLPAITIANRDPAVYPAPERFDIDRYAAGEDTEAARGHLAFGQGAHYCVGAGLARQEVQVALETLTRRLPGLRLAVPAPEVPWTEGMIVQGITELPVTW